MSPDHGTAGAGQHRPLDCRLPLSLGTRLLGTLVMLLPDLVFMLMLWQLLQLFRGYRQAMLFTFSQIRRYQLIGLLLCVSFVTKIITTRCWT